MNSPPQPPGGLLKRLAERVCSPATLETLVDPLIADMQHEYLMACARRARPRPAWVRAQGYLAFWRAVLLHLATQSWRRSLGASAILTGTRWVATPLVALFGTAVVQFAVFKTMMRLLYTIAGIGGLRLATWPAKTFTSVFMGAAFVALVSWTAPRVKLRAAAVALGVVLVWGGRLMLAAFDDGFMAWLFAMGAAGIAGGVFSFLIIRKRLAVRWSRALAR